MNHKYGHIIIVGSQRSGTTLTGQILGAHPKTLTIDEDDGLYKWTNSVINGKTDQKLLHESIKHAERKYMKWETQGHQDAPVLVLKAPNLTFYWNKIHTYFSNPKIIYLYRDIHAVVASIQKLNTVPIIANQTKFFLGNKHISETYPRELSSLSNEDTPPHIKAAIVALIKMSLSHLFMKNNLAVMNLKYETLVTQPENTIRQLLKFVKLPYDEQCYQHEKYYHGFAPGNTDRTRPVDTNSIHNWREVLSNQETYDIDKTITKYMTAHPELKGLLNLISTY